MGPRRLRAEAQEIAAGQRHQERAHRQEQRRLGQEQADPEERGKLNRLTSRYFSLAREEEAEGKNLFAQRLDDEIYWLHTHP